MSNTQGRSKVQKSSGDNCQKILTNWLYPPQVHLHEFFYAMTKLNFRVTLFGFPAPNKGKLYIILKAIIEFALLYIKNVIFLIQNACNQLWLNQNVNLNYFFEETGIRNICLEVVPKIWVQPWSQRLPLRIHPCHQPKPLPP